MAVEEATDDKIHALARVGTLDLRARDPSSGGHTPAGTLPA